MITDILINRYPSNSPVYKNLDNLLCIQLFNLYDKHDLGIKKSLLERAESFNYSGFADEHIRIICQSMEKLCNELGYENLDKKSYTNHDWTYSSYRVFKNYIFDKNINLDEKLSLLEILFRDTERHLKDEILFLEKQIPVYKAEAERMHKASKEKKQNFYNNGQVNLDKALPVLDIKRKALSTLNEEINSRLRNHKIPLAYHNGYFQESDDDMLEDNISQPFWKLLADPKYSVIQEEMLDAIDRLDTNKKDPAQPASRALESLLKILCKEKNLTSNMTDPAGHYVNLLNSKENNSLILNEEKEELFKFFKIRHGYGAHGTGEEKVPTLTHNQAQRFINTAMVWIHSLAKR